jgi:hypothetical protein
MSIVGFQPTTPSLQTGEDSSCFRSRDHRDRRSEFNLQLNCECGSTFKIQNVLKLSSCFFFQTFNISSDVTVFIALKILDIIHCPDPYLKHNVSESGFCLRVQV